jgi:predicted metal-dependent hydrolase
MPRWGSVRYALEFAVKHRDWIHKQLAKSRTSWSQGTPVLFRGTEYTINVSDYGEDFMIEFASIKLRVLRAADLRDAVQSHLRALATPELIQRTRELTSLHGLTIKSVQVRSQRSRWGSCSSKGGISLNWRLIQTPDFVRDYIITHELMHLREMNHSHRFWSHVETACPGFRDAERWLRQHSSLLA